VATMLFYGTGHRPTFEGIQYGAAFVGIDDVSVNGVAHFWCVCVFVCVCVCLCACDSLLQKSES
jgi:hypothetical protein